MEINKLLCVNYEFYACELKQICQGQPMHEQFFYSKCITRTCLTLKMKVKIMGVEHSQWCHSMTNINLCKSHMMKFYDSSHCFQDINV